MRHGRALVDHRPAVHVVPVRERGEATQCLAPAHLKRPCTGPVTANDWPPWAAVRERGEAPSSTRILPASPGADVGRQSRRRCGHTHAPDGHDCPRMPPSRCTAVHFARARTRRRVTSPMMSSSHGDAHLRSVAMRSAAKGCKRASASTQCKARTRPREIGCIASASAVHSRHVAVSEPPQPFCKTYTAVVQPVCSRYLDVRRPLRTDTYPRATLRRPRAFCVLCPRQTPVLD
jgi:hypothetical protein